MKNLSSLCFAFLLCLTFAESLCCAHLPLPQLFGYMQQFSAAVLRRTRAVEAEVDALWYGGWTTRCILILRLFCVDCRSGSVHDTDIALANTFNQFLMLR